MTCSIFIKSYAADVRWLAYCLRSVQKFCTGFREIILVFPEHEKEALRELNLTAEKVCFCKEPPGEGYLAQQVVKLKADHYTDSDFITYLDSDCMVIHPMSPEDLIVGYVVGYARPVILYTPYTSLVKQDGTPDTPWQEITSKALGMRVRYEFMRRHPMTAPRQLLQSFRLYIKKTHGVTVETYVMSQPNREFSEFNALWAYAYYREPEVCHFVNTETGALPPLFVRQWWSWSGLTDAERQEMEKILA